MKMNSILLAIVLKVLFYTTTAKNGEHSKIHERHDEELHNMVKRQDNEDEQRAPPHPPPPIPIADLHVDVGKVNIESQTESCNGVLLEPTFVLTSATCVYPNHTAEPFPDIKFTMGENTKPVIKVFRNPYWYLTGERRENFALLQLQQPMPHLNQKYLLSLTWSPYALEDLGDTYIADPEPTTCNSASNPGRLGDVIRHVGDNPITLSCSNKGTFSAGSPIFRVVDGAPVLYGVYFGHCTTGALDRAVSGSCGARISRQVFQDFCQQAKNLNVDLPSCNSKLLDHTNVNFPTTVFSRKGYDARIERAHNTKDVLFAYHSSASDSFQNFVEEIETFQRDKSVYDKFSISVVDVNILPVVVKAIPYIEFRTKNSKSFMSYTEEYSFTTFRDFIKTFAKTGAPPPGSVSFFYHYQHKRSDIELAEDSSSQLTVNAGDGGTKFATGKSPTCANTGGYYLLPDSKCACLPTHFGTGETCGEIATVFNDGCSYQVNGAAKKYNAIVSDTNEQNKATNWCNDLKKIEVSVAGSGASNGLNPRHCANAISKMIACSSSNVLTASGRNSVNTKSGAPSAGYLSNFEGNTPPGPITHAPNTHYFEVTDASYNPYSVLYDGNRGIPVMVGYKVTHANLGNIVDTKASLRNKWTKIERPGMRIGSNLIYLDRNKKTAPDGVEPGQLNPSQIHTYQGESMDLTFDYLNAFPQYTDFANGVWRKYQEKIITYAKVQCRAKHSTAVFYSVSGVSDYELTGHRSSAFLKPATYWPIAYEGDQPHPYHSPTLQDGVKKSIILPKSVWTVGCCTWTDTDIGEPNAQSVSFWANNKPRGIPKHGIQPDLRTLASRLYPGKPCFQFFPSNPQCNIPENHYTLEP